MLTIEKTHTVPVQSSEDVVKVRQLTREWALDRGLGLVDQTKIVTAASELARNMVIYGGGGEVRLEAILNDRQKGVRLTFRDDGPGIPDVERAMRDGYTTGQGLGLGLGGARRLCNEFQIESAPGKGTTVVIVRWKT
jgi:serine/threonine-protein kinase RsbT